MFSLPEESVMSSISSFTVGLGHAGLRTITTVRAGLRDWTAL
jgi:hypothetical protein